MDIYSNLALLATLIVFVVDLSGFTDAWKGALRRWLKTETLRPLHPFDCSLCSVWWGSIFYLLIVGGLSFATLAASALLAFLTPVIGKGLLLLLHALELLIEILERKINSSYENFN